MKGTWSAHLMTNDTGDLWLVITDAAERTVAVSPPINHRYPFADDGLELYTDTTNLRWADDNLTHVVQDTEITR